MVVKVSYKTKFENELGRVRAQYSGLVSTKFWRRIAEIDNVKVRAVAYIAACALQDHENRVLQILSKLEKRKGSPRHPR